MYLLLLVITIVAALFLRKNSPEKFEIKIKHAGFFSRWIGLFLDNIINLAVCVLILYVVDVLIFRSSINELAANGQSKYRVSEIICSLFLLYNLTYLVGKKGQSWGRTIKGIKVIDYAGNTIGFWKALIRNLLAMLISGPILGLGYLWTIWDKDKQAWHDKIMKTYVIDVESPNI